MESFAAKMSAKIAQGKHLCVGVDPTPEKHPEGVSNLQYIFRYIERTIGVAACFKPNIGFFESRGIQGFSEYMATVACIQNLDPEMPIIGDWKRADIGATNEGYAKAAFDQVELDSITVNPYFGLEDSIDVFLKREGKVSIVLCRTSSRGSREFQNRIVLVDDDPVNGKDRVPLYQLVARNVYRDWSKVSGLDSLGLVVGATAPEELEEVRQIAPDIFLLIPGVGRQQGDLERCVRAAYNPRATMDFVINVSSGLMYPDPNDLTKSEEAANNYDWQIREIISSLS